MLALRAKAVLVASLLVAVAHTTRAGAQAADPHAANERFMSGVEAAQRGELARAAAEFEAAYALSPKPVVLYNLGQTQTGLGRPVQAVRSLRKYLATEPSMAPERRQQVEELIRANELRIGVVELEVVPPEAKLEADAEPVTLEGGRLSLGAGRHLIVGTRDGYAPGVLNLDVGAGTVSRARLELRPLTPALPLAVDMQHPPAQRLELERPIPAVRESTRTQSSLALGTAGLGVVALGLAGGFGLSAHDLGKTAEANGHCDSHGCDDVGYPLSRTAHRRADWATGLFVAGGALLAGGLTWYFVLDASARASAPAHAATTH